MLTNIFTQFGYDDLKKLNFREGNRMITKRHVNQLIQSIKEGCIFPPIRVNRTTNTLLDGQHRRAAFMFAVEKGIIPPDSTLYVQFDTLDEAKEMGTVWGLNCNNKSWSMDDFVMSHSTHNDSFIKLMEFCRTHVLYHPNTKKENGDTGNIRYKTRAAANLLKWGVSQQNNLKDGSFNLDDVDYELVEVVYNELETFLNSINFRPNSDVLEVLQKAWFEKRNKHEFSKWQKAFNDTDVKDEFNLSRPTTKKKDWDRFLRFVSDVASEK